jgi:hypothetical protein
MDDESVVGFWSYTHEDNKLDGGAILDLSRKVMEEYNLLSGEPLKLFVDNDSIAWGQEWRARIDLALAQTTFFIPIITPRYFTRPECQRELLEFAAKAKSLGVEDLLLPILYIETPDLSDESPDEAVALVARTQYVDWRANRLLEPGSREYRTAVNSLARRLLEIARQVAERQLDRELSMDLEGDAVDGIADLVAQIMRLLPDWLDAVMGEQVNDAQITATWDQHRNRLTRLKKANAPASAILATQMNVAREMLPLAERSQKDARIYLARSVELDPLVSEVARLVSEHPESFQLVMPIRDAIDEAMTQIMKGEEDKARGARSIQSRFDDMRHLGRIFQKCNAMWRVKSQAAKEGNAIVRRWDAELIDRSGDQS